MSAVATELESPQLDAQTTSLSVEVISDEESFLLLEPIWNRLVEEANVAHPFLTFPWVRTWWECFGSGNKLHILVAKAGDTAIGIAPLMLTRRRMYGVSLRCVEFIANVHTPRFDFIVPDHHPEAYRAIWNHLLAENASWDLLLLTQLPEESLTLEHLSRLAENKQFPVGRWCSAHSPYVPLVGDWDSYVKNLDGKHRNNLRRRLRRLSELGAVSLEVVSATEKLGTALDEGFQLEGASWKDKNKTSIRSHPAVLLFYARLAERCADLGWLLLHFLKVNSQRIAFQYSLSYKKNVFLLKPGYDPAHARYSPTNLLCFLFLERAFREGVKEFDLLGVEEEWKLQWARNTRPHYWLFVFSRSPLPSTLYFLKFRLLPALQESKAYKSLRRAVVALRHRLGVSEASL